MGSNSSKVGKCLDCTHVCVESDAIQSEEHSTASVSGDMTKNGRGDETIEGTFKVSTARQEQRSTLKTDHLKLSSMNNNATQYIEKRQENVEISEEEAAKKTKVVPQYNNGQSMVYMLNRHFNYLQSVEKGISSTTGSGHERFTRDKQTTLDDGPY